METNVSGQQYSEREYQDIKPAKGDCVAFFNFGSTVVMVFEAPDFVFHVHPRQRVIMGQVMGEVRVSRRRVEEESDALA
jgi:phosphatidylserine decarboxylase